jgi:hypothetical protein
MTDLTACLIVGFHPDFDQHPGSLKPISIATKRGPTAFATMITKSPLRMPYPIHKASPAASTASFWTRGRWLILLEALSPLAGCRRATLGQPPKCNDGNEHARPLL